MTSIDDYAFSGCTGLSSLSFPNSVTNIGNFAFQGCTGLTFLDIPKSLKIIQVGVFYGCKGLTSITIPNSVTSIENDAFYECTGLSSITIPNSITYIGDYAFSVHKGLSYIECHALLPPTISYSSFYFFPKNIPLYVPEESINAYKTAYVWKDFLDIRPLTSVRTEPVNSIELVVYPNPVKDRVSIKGLGQNAMVKVYDINGHQVFSSGTIQENEFIDIGFLPSGVYVFKVFQNDWSSYVRVVKE